MKTKTKKTKAAVTVWSERTDKRISEIKQLALKNGNHFIYMIVDKGNGASEGYMVGHNVQSEKIARGFVSAFPDVQELAETALKKLITGELAGVKMKKSKKPAKKTKK